MAMEASTKLIEAIEFGVYLNVQTCDGFFMAEAKTWVIYTDYYIVRWLRILPFSYLFLNVTNMSEDVGHYSPQIGWEKLVDEFELITGRCSVRCRIEFNVVKYATDCRNCWVLWKKNLVYTLQLKSIKYFKLWEN